MLIETFEASRRLASILVQHARASAERQAPADRVFHGRGHFETCVRPDNTALPKLGLGFGKWRHRDTAVPFSMGQSSGDSNLVAWRPARHSTHL
jgi:hypothetical protein